MHILMTKQLKREGCVCGGGGGGGGGAEKDPISLPKVDHGLPGSVEAYLDKIKITNIKVLAPHSKHSAEMCDSSDDDDDEVMLNVLRCQLTY